MPTADSLHCPNCGAAVEPDAGRCPYCHARLATISCPACFARMFEDAAFCPTCGAARRRTDGGKIAAPCPACRGTMCEIAVGTATMLECERCDGVWVEASAFERICADRDAQAAVLHRTCGAAPVETDRVRYRPCVRCGKLMNRVNFGKLSGTIVDVCSGHGTFLDAGELHRIVTFVQEGGLDRARERQVEDLHEAERRLREAELMAGRRQSGTLDPTSDRNGVNELLRMLLGIEPEQR